MYVVSQYLINRWIKYRKRPTTDPCDTSLIIFLINSPCLSVFFYVYFIYKFKVSTQSNPLSQLFGPSPKAELSFLPIYSVLLETCL